jgi:hypothetical protein
MANFLDLPDEILVSIASHILPSDLIDSVAPAGDFIVALCKHYPDTVKWAKLFESSTIRI